MIQTTSLHYQSAAGSGAPLLREGVLQRKCACGQYTHGGSCDECRKKTQGLRRKDKGASPTAVPPIVHDVLRSPGQPLDTSARAFFEPRFGRDFSGVRVHTDRHAGHSAQAVSASAYTVGRDIVFDTGRYAPGTGDGNRLLAHELTHVVQQEGSSPVTGDRLTVAGHDHFESEAERAARDVSEASSIPDLSGVGERHATIISRAPTASLQLEPLATRGPGNKEEKPAAAAPGGAQATTAPARKVRVWFNTFIPQSQIDGPPGSQCFKGDGRSFSSALDASSRTHQEVEFDVGSLAETVDLKKTGKTHEVNCKTGALVQSGQAPASQLTNGKPNRFGDEVVVNFTVDAKNPLVSLAPAINAEADFHVNPGLRWCGLQGEHDEFPGYEAYVAADGGTATKVYTYDPIAEGEGISALFPPMDKKVSGSGTKF